MLAPSDGASRARPGLTSGSPPAGPPCRSRSGCAAGLTARPSSCRPRIRAPGLRPSTWWSRRSTTACGATMFLRSPAPPTVSTPSAWASELERFAMARIAPLPHPQGRADRRRPVARVRPDPPARAREHGAVRAWPGRSRAIGRRAAGQLHPPHPGARRRPILIRAPRPPARLDLGRDRREPLLRVPGGRRRDPGYRGFHQPRHRCGRHRQAGLCPVDAPAQEGR